MSLNDTANEYLAAFRAGAPFPGGLAFSTALAQSRLDGTVESLDRIDHLLDRIRERVKPEFGAFLEAPANQNFLYLLCFYVGYVAASCTDQRIAWLTYAEMIEAIPGNGAMFPDCFATSATCILEKSGFYAPMSVIQERLFTDPPEKSVAFSASGAMSGWV